MQRTHVSGYTDTHETISGTASERDMAMTKLMKAQPTQPLSLEEKHRPLQLRRLIMPRLTSCFGRNNAIIAFDISDLNRAIVKRLQNDTLACFTNDTTLTEYGAIMSPRISTRSAAIPTYLSNTNTEHWLKIQVLKARYGLLFNAEDTSFKGAVGMETAPYDATAARYVGPTPDSIRRPHTRWVSRTRH